MVSKPPAVKTIDLRPSSAYKHVEAFCLMWYACECGHRERLWNSRDGVTPFGFKCTSCPKGIAHHIHWKSDERRPDYIPVPGQHIWRDGTPEEAAQIMRRRLDQMSAQYPKTLEEEAELIAQARSGKLDEFQPGWPHMDTQK